MIDGKELKEKLFVKKENGWKNIDDTQMKEIFEYCDGYINFLNNAKTEREVVAYAKNLAEENGFRDISKCNNLKPGDKVYSINRQKSMFMAVIGEEDIENGINIIGAHADSPRLDLKQNPIYEDGEGVYLKTHYYGGIKKYQWTTIPLAIHGVIIKKNGEKIEVRIGEDEKEPIFTITDLLPHLAQEQMERKLKEGVKGEDLNLLIGSIPYQDNSVTEAIKLNTLNILNEKYGIVEEDLFSSEIEIVPAFKARNMGFDWSMVAGYGQDDKVCSYTSMTAMMTIEKPKKTAICILSDKEEIGSVGNTGMESQMFENFILQILDKAYENKVSLMQKVFSKSKMLSADVDGGYDTIYADAFERNNSAFLGRGITLNKYTGARGKSGASDANAEYVAEIKNMLEKNNIKYQFSELGRIDLGGGGTIAYILANKGIDVIDCGVPILSMHSPYEVCNKFDIFSAYKTYKAFWNM